MIIDKQNHFNYGKQAVTASAASTDVLDLGKAGVTYGAGSLFLVSRVGAAFEAEGSATLTISLQTATDEAFTSPITVLSSGAIAKAALTANTIMQKADLNALPLQRYVRVYYTVATGPMTAGTIESFLTPDVKV